MTNREKYAEEIKNFKGHFCNGFVSQIILKTIKCTDIDCSYCRMLQMLWLDEEYVETEQKVDWSKVEIDTPILVRDRTNEKWNKRYFASYEDGRIYTWFEGRTSWSAVGKNDTTCWRPAKLAEEGDKK